MSVDTGILDTLAKEHQRMVQLLEQVESLGEDHEKGPVEQRQALYAQLRGELLAHAAAELKALYSPLQSHPEARALAAHLEQQNEYIEEDLLALDRMDTSDPDWLRRFAQLAERVQEHLEEEEGELFTMADEVLTFEELEELDEEYQVEKERELERFAEAATAP